ncbi:hypothetical protein ABZX30_30845 [Streptomyces sp. NPDC004542]|uniref:hypothetical protein n=1 Tax=Streptomyces sp. NPDC004542 TaxID=3154281 RepID=UPI0033B6D8F7
MTETPMTATPTNEVPGSGKHPTEARGTGTPTTRKPTAGTPTAGTRGSERPPAEARGTETPPAEARRDGVTPVTPVTPVSPRAAAGERGTATPAPTASASSLVPHEETDKLGQRLHHAVAGFVDEPRDAVEEADRVLEEIAARFTEAVTQRRRTLRTSWQSTGDKPGATADTEQLRLALRDYREMAERLLHL